MARRNKTISIGTNYGSFKCLFEVEKEMGGYDVEEKKFPGAVSWEKNILQAKKKIREAIEGAIEAEAIIQAERKGIIQIKNRRHSQFV